MYLLLLKCTTYSASLSRSTVYWSKMARAHVTSTAKALYRVFVLPPLTAGPPRAAIATLPLTRPFSQTSIRCRAGSRPPEVRQQKWNDEINSEFVHIVEADGRLSGAPRRLRSVLASLDLRESRVIQLTKEGDETPDGLPICRIRNIKEFVDEERRNKARQKEQRKESKLRTEPKSLELNWAIDQNDLGHRMGKLRGFLAEGRRVEMILAAKKRGRKASMEECEALLERIRTEAESVPGTTFMGELDGKLGAFSTLKIQGKAQESSKDTGS